MHRRSQSRCVTYKEGPQIRGNGVPSKMHPVDKIRGHLSVSQKKIRMRDRRVGPIEGSAEPRRPPVHMHFDVACPLPYPITFHMCVWRELTSK